MGKFKHKRHSKLDESYIGREIYFEMSKKKAYKSTITNLTPNKKYKIIDIDVNLAGVIDDKGTIIYVSLWFLSNYLDKLTKFCVTNRRPPSNG